MAALPLTETLRFAGAGEAQRRAVHCFELLLLTPKVTRLLLAGFGVFGLGLRQKLFESGDALGVERVSAQEF